MSRTLEHRGDFPVFKVTGSGYGGRVTPAWRLSLPKGWCCSGCNSISTHYPNPLPMFVQPPIAKCTYYGVWGMELNMIRRDFYAQIRKSLPGAITAPIFIVKRKYYDLQKASYAFDPTKYDVMADYWSIYGDPKKTILAWHAHAEPSSSCGVCQKPRSIVTEIGNISKKQWGKRKAALSTSNDLFLANELVEKIDWTDLPNVRFEPVILV